MSKSLKPISSTSNNKTMLGSLTHPEIDQLIKDQSLGRIGYTSNGKTYIIPITYAFDGQYLYGHSREGKKIQIMRSNPFICFQIDAIQNLANWKSVIIQGEFEELIGKQARETMRFFIEQLQPQLLSSTSTPTHGLSHFHRNEHSALRSIIFRIKILEKTGRFERHK